MAEKPDRPEPRFDDPSTELSSRRTGMSFQRTRMSADRTLMSVIRTALSLISFGFTIFQIFQKISDQKLITGGAAPGRNFGTSLVLLGIIMLILGIIYHVQFMLRLRHTKDKLTAQGLLHTEMFPVSITLLTGILLLFIGIGAILSMVFQIGPFGWRQLFQFFRMTFAGGLLFLAPFVVLIIVFEKARGITQQLVQPLVGLSPIDNVIGVRMEKVLAVSAILLVCFLAGCLARLALARKMVTWMEATLLVNVPGYEFIKGSAENMLGVAPSHKWEVVLADLNDCVQFGFLVERLESQFATVFLPGAPDGRSGTVVFLPAERVLPLNVTQAAALKCLKRLGAGSGVINGLKQLADNKTENK